MTHNPGNPGNPGNPDDPGRQDGNVGNASSVTSKTASGARASRARRPARGAGADTAAEIAALGLPSIAPLRQLTRNWRARRALRQQRLGQWVWITRARMGLTFRQVEALARDDGEFLSLRQLLRLEQLREGFASPEEAREYISLPSIDWLATISGQSLADVERYLRSGDARDLAPDTEANAHILRAVFLSLNPEHQRAALDFAQFLYQMEDAATQGSLGIQGTQASQAALGIQAAMRTSAQVMPFPVPGMPNVSDAPGVPNESPDGVSAAEREVLNVRAELEAALAKVEAEGDQGDQGDQGDAGRRKRRRKG